MLISTTSQLDVDHYFAFLQPGEHHNVYAKRKIQLVRISMTSDTKAAGKFLTLTLSAGAPNEMPGANGVQYTTFNLEQRLASLAC